MENQTRHDLNAAIENWRQELAAQSNLTAEVRRELETHLRDAIAGFQQRGLNDDESFWLARRRVGDPRQLGDEFAKANPTAVWRERVLWMAAALLAVSLWGATANIVHSAIINSVNKLSGQGVGHHWFWQASALQIISSFVLRTSPFVAFVVLLLRGNGQIFSRLAAMLQSRSRFVITVVGWWTLNEGFVIFRWLALLKHPNPLNGPVVFLWTNFLTTSIWPLALIVLVAWLMPPENRMTAEHA